MENAKRKKEMARVPAEKTRKSLAELLEEVRKSKGEVEEEKIQGVMEQEMMEEEKKSGKRKRVRILYRPDPKVRAMYLSRRAKLKKETNYDGSPEAENRLTLAILNDDEFWRKIQDTLPSYIDYRMKEEGDRRFGPWKPLGNWLRSDQAFETMMAIRDNLPFCFQKLTSQNLLINLLVSSAKSYRFTDALVRPVSTL